MIQLMGERNGIIMESTETASARLRSVVPAQRVRPARAVAPVGPSRGNSTAEPHIELVREGDVVRAIDITCACGQHFRLRCVYDQAGG
jgi:hypothetical protein